MLLFKTTAVSSCRNKYRSHMAPPSKIPFVLHASLSNKCGTSGHSKTRWSRIVAVLLLHAWREVHLDYGSETEQNRIGNQTMTIRNWLFLSLFTTVFPGFLFVNNEDINECGSFSNWYWLSSQSMIPPKRRYVLKLMARLQLWRSCGLISAVYGIGASFCSSIMVKRAWCGFQFQLCVGLLQRSWPRRRRLKAVWTILVSITAEVEVNEDLAA